MSALVGLCQPPGKRADRSDLGRMLDQLAHCPVDDVGIWCNEHVGLGHHLLRTTPESIREILPLFNSSSALAITCDARIDNRRELIHVCALQGPEQDLPDSQLILAAYQRWGASCVERLLGDFAFAIWDGGKRQLFCARDPFGIKPFFYHQSGAGFVFASQIKALFAIPEVPRSLNESRILDHLSGSFSNRETTFFNGIFRLPPGHFLVARPDGLEIRPYWKAEAPLEVRPGSDREYAEEFRTLLNEAVRCRMRSTSPVGSLLSGGLDSSSIVSVARSQLLASGASGPLHTFSSLFEGFSDTDERPFINAVIGEGGCLPHLFDCHDVNPLTDLDAVLADMDEVFHAGDMTRRRMFLDNAKRLGVRVILDGLGGDEVVSNVSPYLVELLRTGGWPRFGHEAVSLAQNYKMDRRGFVREHLQPYLAELKHQRAWSTLAKALLRMPRHVDESIPRFIGDYALMPIARKLRRRFGFSSQLPAALASGSILNDDFARSLTIQSPAKTSDTTPPGGVPTAREAHCQKLNSCILWLNIEEQGRVGARYGVETRYPLLDKRIVEFCLSLPSNQKVSEGWDRAVFRRAMDQMLPENVCWRAGKATFLTPFAQGVRNYGRAFLEEAIMRTPPNCAPYFNLPVLRDKYRLFLGGDDSHTLDVWRASSLISWLQRAKLSVSSSREASRVCEARV